MRLILALSALSLIAAPVTASTRHCRDTHGKFVKCAKAEAKVVRCRDTKGHFAKCK